jgi:hypothetical protein
MTLFMMLCVFCICFFALIINQSKE